MRTVCAPGYGGPACMICDVGKFSAGGNSTVAKPECSSCPAGSTTLATGSQDAGACSTGDVQNLSQGELDMD